MHKTCQSCVCFSHILICIWNLSVNNSEFSPVIYLQLPWAYSFPVSGPKSNLNDSVDDQGMMRCKMLIHEHKIILRDEKNLREWNPKMSGCISEKDMKMIYSHLLHSFSLCLYVTFLLVFKANWCHKCKLETVLRHIGPGLKYSAVKYQHHFAFF